MTTANWIKVFGIFMLVDIGSIPARLRYRFLATITAFFAFQQRKIYEEESSFFRFLFAPAIMVMMTSSKIKAHRRGLPWGAFLKLERAEVDAERVMLEQKGRQQRIRNMELLADAMPGATVTDYENLIEKRPLLSLMFLRSSLWK